jgi:hypothetical protein
MSIEITTDYASPLMNTGFKQLMSLDGEGGDIVAVSVLNSFVPDFQINPIKSLTAAPVDVPLIKEGNYRVLSMDYHAINERGEHVTVEIQLHRHIAFDERALFYAARTYSNQVSKEDLVSDRNYEHSKKGNRWFEKLKKTYSIQIVDYDSKRATGINNPNLKDKLIERVDDHPMKDGDFIKHFLMTDRFSGQQIDHLQMIQVELPRAKKLDLFPPNRDFTEQMWWLSVLKYSEKYTAEYIQQLHEEGIMRYEIYEGFSRIKYDKWNSALQSNYQKDLTEIHEFYAPQIAMDLNEARDEGIAIGEERGIAIGEHKSAIKTAEKLLSAGIDENSIANFLDLSIDEIRALKSH